MGKYTSRLKVIEKRIPRKQIGETQTWLHMEDGTIHSRDEILTEEQFNERYQDVEVIRLWYPEGQQE